MANPRQRRKARSSSHRAVKTFNAKKLRKHPALIGPDVLKKAWDVKKTVRQNYAALGLTSSLAPRPSGGLENNLTSSKGAATEASSLPGAAEPANADTSASAPAPPQTGPKPVPKGFGRIVRDADGNVVDVILPEDEEDAEEAVDDVDMDGAGAGEAVSQKRKKGKGKAKDAETPWGPPMEDWVPDSAVVADRVISAQKTRSTAVTEELERLASQNTKIPRYASAGEVELLRALIHKHGDDVEAMSRDRKLNRWQKTAGEIRRAIKKAGGQDVILTAA